MSIGEYYKLLMEGKRPTRQRTVKEEEKKMPTQAQMSAPALARGVSTSSAMNQTSGAAGSHHIPRKVGESGALGRSQSEVPGQLGGKINSEKSAVVIARPSLHHDRSINKRKLKMKTKMKFTQEDGIGSAPKPRHAEERKGSSPKIEAPKSSQESAPNRLESALSKLRHREHNPSRKNFQNPKKRKEQGRSGKRGADENLEEERKNTLASQLSQKFELVEVHPLFANGRFACDRTTAKDGVLRMFRVSQVISEKDAYIVTLNDPNGSHFNLNQALFTSKLFFISSSKLPNDLQGPPHRVLTQLVSSEPSEAGDPPTFGVLTKIDIDGGVNVQHVKLADAVNLYEDLREITSFDESIFKEVNDAYLNYVTATQKIPLTKDNLEEFLFSYVQYQACENQGSIIEENKAKPMKSGVYLRAKFDPQYFKEHLIFIKKIGGGQKTSKAANGVGSYKEIRSEWLQISKHRIFADISKGFVSLDCLQFPSNDGSMRLKKRNLHFISYRESLAQRNDLRQISQQIQDNEERKAPLLRDSTQRPGDRCVLCNYQAQGIDHLRCNCCNKVFHEQCCLLQPKRLHQLYLGFRETNWRCPDCIRCVNCLCLAGKSQAQQLLVCKCCNTAYHFECLDPTVKLTIPNIIPENNIQRISDCSGPKAQPSITDVDFHCEKCVQCLQCGSREAGKSRQNKWSKDFKLCSNCNKKRKKHQYCKICECLWPDDIVQEANEGLPQPSQQATVSKLQDYLLTNMINCGKCQTWVHFECDRIFEDEGIKKRFQAAVAGDSSYPFAQEILQYHCQDCRNKERSQLIRQVIENLSKEDKNFIFQEPVENIIANYTKIIKTPMCFNYVRDRAKLNGDNKYLTDPASMRKDISLIFENAMKFNLPKHKVHKEAQRLGEVCSAVLDTIWTRLEQNSARTLDENKHKEWLRHVRVLKLEQTLKEAGQKLLRQSEEQKSDLPRPIYQLKLEELFDQSEFQPSSSQGNNGALDLQIDAHMAQLSDDQQYLDSPSRGFAAGFDYDEEDDDDEQLDEDDDEDMMDNSQELMVPPLPRKQISGTVAKQRNSKGNISSQGAIASARYGNKGKIRSGGGKNVDFNEDKNESLVGSKRLGEGEIAPKGAQFSSKKARYQQQQAQFASQYSFNSLGQKGANLLQQAFHQVEKQNMQSQNLDPHHSNVSFVQVQHASADNATQAPLNHVLQHQQMMINYYQEMDDDRCYYSNPARCSFDDPHLCFEEMCYLCGSFGNKQDFLSCTLCGESFHTYCLQLMPASTQTSGEDQQHTQVITDEEDRYLIAKFQPYWKCLNCKFCDICSSATQEAFLLYCDVCDKAFHSFCLSPPLKTIPKCQWKCQECFKCKTCGTNSFFDPLTHHKPGTNQLLDSIEQTLTNDFEFSKNFSLCYECGMNEHKKSFCKICQSNKTQTAVKEGTEGNNDESTIVLNRRSRHGGAKQGSRNGAGNGQDKMLKCKSCGYYCHVKCSRLLPCETMGEEEDFDDFKCLECLLTGKSINHLIRETCEHYENMHNIIHRQKLLAQLCSQILSSYIPFPDKAPLFIKAFIEQNQEFFKKDAVIVEWLSLLETGVNFVQDDSTAQSDHNLTEPKVSCEKQEKEINIPEQEDVPMNKGNEVDKEMNFSKKVYWDSTALQQRVFKLEITSSNQEQLEAQKAYDNIFSHKEGFLPPKRNLYDALDSQEGYHRFGQRKHFADPFSDEIQNLLTLPIDEVLDDEVDFAQLFSEAEFQAVMKIKLKFFAWFEKNLLQIAERNTRKTCKQNIYLSNEEPLAQNINNEDSSHDHVLSSYLGGQDLPSSVADQHNHIRDQGYFCVEDDVMIDNPQKRLQCIMCKMKGEYTITGRLIPFQVNQFVHVNCALWSTDVHEIAEGGYLINFFQLWSTRAKFTKCNHCGETGASLFCSSTRLRCMAAYHFPCAYRNKKMAFAPKNGKETICDSCCKNQRGIQPGLPQEYANSKRRFQIAKNQQPWNMTHHMIRLDLQQQSQVAPNIPINGGSTSAADIEKPLLIEKWRPFYFDMFNRVGNLTVLSLKKEINHIIEEYCGASKNNQTDSLNDFSTIRIYWKYLNTLQEEQKMEDGEVKQPEEKSKTFYLYSNNSIQELFYKDLEALVPNASLRVKEKINLGLHYMNQKPEQMREIIQLRKNVYSEFINQQVFWQRLLHHFQQERARFSLQNIIFSISEFTGKTKYPISVWNRCPDGMRNKTFFIRSGEQVLLAQEQQSYASIDSKEVARDGSTNGQGVFPIGFGNAQNTFGAIRRGEAQSYAGNGNQGARGGVPMNIDDIFRRMTKINQMREHQNPMASIKRVNASKHMQYEAVLQNLGKKMFYKAPPANASLFEDPTQTAPSQAKKQNTNQGSNQSGPTHKGLQKKAKQADTVEGQIQGKLVGGDPAMNSKESDLPIPMRYRLSKTQPKRVEVGPSKIHRNGLFTHEDLAANEIVIEYVGEKIRNKVADKREIVYEQKGIGDCYLFRLDKEYIIDATFHGNKARYLNHSCDANCSAKIINVQQQKHIIISANRPIKSGEELTYNYNFDYEADKIECFCGAPGCLGRLN